MEIKKIPLLRSDVETLLIRMLLTTSADYYKIVDVYDSPVD